MSRQTSFLLSSEDLIEIDKELQKIKDIIYLEERHKSNSLELKSGILDSKNLTILITLATLKNEIRVKFIETQGYWLVDELFSPVIEFFKRNSSIEVLRCGRVYFTKGYYDKSGNWIEWPAEFLELGDKIMKIIKKYCKKERIGDVYIGPHAKAWKEKGGKILWN